MMRSRLNSYFEVRLYDCYDFRERAMSFQWVQLAMHDPRGDSIVDYQPDYSLNADKDFHDSKATMTRRDLRLALDFD